MFGERHTAISWWVVISVTLLGLVGVIVSAPRATAAALVNSASIDRVRTLIAVWDDDRGVAALAPASGGEVQRLQTAHRLDPDSLSARRGLAQTLFSSGQIKEALAVLGNEERYFLLRGEQRPDVWLLRACVLAQSGDVDEAIRSWQRGADLAVQRWPANQYQLAEAAGATMYQLLLRQQPDRHDWRFLRARLL